jgi:hypothetical protein
MAHSSPTLEGFRAIIRRPALVFAEITWRWTFGAAASFLLIFATLEYLNSLTVTSGERLFLRSRQPFLISQAIAQIFNGSTPRLLHAAFIVVPALAVFWIIAASFGRAATLGSLLDYFGSSRDRNKGKLFSLFGLNFLRVALAFAGAVSTLGAAIVSGLASSPAHINPGLVLLIFLALATLVALLWSTLNWYLSVAPLFVMRDQQDTFGAIAASADFARTYASPVFWSSTVFGLLHLLFFMAASVAALIPMAFTTVLPPGIIVLAVTLITFIYLGIADLLYIGRLAAYVAILEESHAPSAPMTRPQSSQLSACSQPEAHMRDEDDILSDIPGLLPPPEATT